LCLGAVALCGTGLDLATGAFAAFFLALFFVITPRATRFHASRDGRFTVFGLTKRLPKKRGLLNDVVVTIDIDTDYDLGTVEWLFPVFQFDGFGTRDLDVVKAFCAAAQVKCKVSERFANSADDYTDNRDSNIDWWRNGVPVVGGLMGIGFLVAICLNECRSSSARERSPSFSLTNRSLTGTFRSTNAKLGAWTLSPAHCVSGRERGFVGVAFDFAPGSPVEEIRLDAAREGDNVVEVRLADRAGTVYRVRERECEAITGRTEQSNITLNGRPLLRLVGNNHFACAAQGLYGDATYDGCLPTDL
jgi:hypothetical protein